MKSRILMSCLLLIMLGFASCSADNQENAGGVPLWQLSETVMQSFMDNDILYKGIKANDGYFVADPDDMEAVVAKYDDNGELLWEKKYAYENKYFTIDDFVTTRDNGFAFVIAPYSYMMGDTWIQGVPVIIRCDMSGKMLWSRRYEGYCDGAIKRIFETESGEIITVGYPQNELSPPGHTYTNIYITKLSKNGDLIAEKKYGGSDFESLHDTAFTDDGSLICALHTQSEDGDFGYATNGTSVWVVAKFDASLNLSWYKLINDGVGGILQYDEGIYIKTYSDGRTCIKKLSTDGTGMWAKIIEGDYADMNKTIIYQHIVLSQEGRLIFLNADGTIEQEFNFDGGRVEKIIPYTDYLLVISYRITGRLKQPPQYSSIWYSTERVYSGFDRDGNMVWQYAYDNTPDFMKEYQNIQE